MPSPTNNSAAESGKSEKDTWFSVLSVPGNIRQASMPFVLDPKNRINTHVDRSDKLNGEKAQFFTFRRQGKEDKATTGLLNVCPSFYMSPDFMHLLKRDVSFRSLYTYKGEPKFRVRDLLNMMPAVRVREYTPDLRIDQMINVINGFVSLMGNAVKSGWTALKETYKKAKGQTGEKTENDADFFAKAVMWVTENSQAAMKGAIEGAAKGLGHLKKVFSTMTSWTAEPSGRPLPTLDDAWGVNGKNGWLSGLLNFPFAMYYRLQSSITTNVYELPCRMDSAFDLNGQAGWPNTGRWGPSDTKLGKIFEKIPVIGDFMQGMFGNLRINYAPNWNAKEGSDGPYPSMSVKFSLFNDSLDSAVMNYIFVNTIAANNMWVQDRFLQHSNSVYDVRVEGQPRLFMCKGSVKVVNKGVLRYPSDAFFDTLLGKHLNPLFGVKPLAKNAEEEEKKAAKKKNEALKKMLFGNNVVRIPDVYEVELQFTSMFPMNFNNYLFKFAYDDNMAGPLKTNAYNDQYMTQLTSAVEQWEKQLKTPVPQK